MDKRSRPIACLVIGVGNPHRSDDAAGLAAARLLRRQLKPRLSQQLNQQPDIAAGLQVEILESTGDGAELIEHFSRARAVILIDAAHRAAEVVGSVYRVADENVSSDSPRPGSIHRIDAVAGPVPISLLSGTSHAFGVAEAVEVARALGKLPERLIIYGIEAKSFEIGGEMSEEVGAAVEEVATLIGRDWTTALTSVAS